MNLPECRTFDDVRGAIRRLCDGLSQHGEELAAKELHRKLTHPWSGSSEMLEELTISLLQVRRQVDYTLGTEGLELLDSAVRTMKRLWNGE